MQKKQIKKVKAFSLIEIIISLAIFSIIITGVLTISISLISAQKKIQAELFLTQSVQTSLESMSRQIRFGYAYAGNTQTVFDTSEAGQTIYVNSTDISSASGSSGFLSQNLTNAENSPFVIFEGQGGNPNSLTDQTAFCSFGGKLYKVSSFAVETNGTTFKARCDSGVPMLPDNIIIEKISFDVYGDDSQNPKNPMVRIKIRLKHEDTGSVDIQTTVTQRLVTYF